MQTKASADPNAEALALLGSAGGKPSESLLLSIMWHEIAGVFLLRADCKPFWFALRRGDAAGLFGGGLQLPKEPAGTQLSI